MRIDLTVKYQCGCTADVRTDVHLPAELARAERTETNDRRIIEYIVENYAIERWRCPKGHGFDVPSGFREIVSINN